MDYNYIVVNKTYLNGHKSHDTKEKANKRAEEIAEKNEGDEFYVIKVVGSVKAKIACYDYDWKFPSSDEEDKDKESLHVG